MLVVAPVFGCNPKREPPQQTPTGASVASASGAGGAFSVGSGVTSVTSGPAPDVEHCACIFASKHAAPCQACAFEEQSGSCADEWSACDADADCAALANLCVGAASNDAATIDACLGPEGKVRSLLEAYYDCLCKAVNCATECNDSGECGASSSSASTASSSTASSSTDASSSASSTTTSTGAPDGFP